MTYSFVLHTSIIYIDIDFDQKKNKKLPSIPLTERRLERNLNEKQIYSSVDQEVKLFS